MHMYKINSLIDMGSKINYKAIYIYQTSSKISLTKIRDISNIHCKLLNTNMVIRDINGRAKNNYTGP